MTFLRQINAVAAEVARLTCRGCIWRSTGTAVALILFYVTWVIVPAAANRPVPLDNERRAENRMCGPNSLYMLLQLHSIATTPNKIRQYIPDHPSGMSLTEIRDACRELGLPAEVRHIDGEFPPNSVTLPVIAHCTGRGAGTGHYMVVVLAERHHVSFLDGTTGARQTMTGGDFANYCSGYLVVPSPSWGRRSRRSILSAAAILLLWWSVIPPRRWRWLAMVRNLPRRIWALGFGSPERLPMFAIVFLCNMIRTGNAQTSPADATTASGRHIAGAWREPGNNGLNCLYSLLRLLGYSGSYDAFRMHAADPGQYQSLNSLKILAGRLGFELTVAQLSGSEVVALRVPVMLHMEQEGVKTGSFSLLLDSDEQSVRLIDGPTVRWMEMPRDRFERSLTGFALVPAQRNRRSDVVRRFSAAFVSAYVAFSFWHRKRSQRGPLCNTGTPVTT